MTETVQIVIKLETLNELQQCMKKFNLEGIDETIMLVALLVNTGSVIAKYKKCRRCERPMLADEDGYYSCKYCKVGYSPSAI